jgi:hypothetical protein
VGLDDDLGIGGFLVRGGDAGKLLDLTSAGLFIETFGVTLLGNLEGHVDVDLDEWDRLVVCARGLLVQRASQIPVCSVGGDEGGDGNG